MTSASPDHTARMLHIVVSRAIGLYGGRQSPSLADKRLAARLLTQPGSPLEQFDPAMFTEGNGTSAHTVDITTLIP